MPVMDVLQARRNEILDRWCGMLLDAYPQESRRFYAAERDPFRNPVGATVRRGAAVLLDAVLSGEWGSEAEAALEGLVRLRSIQGMPPSRALGFVSQLKGLLRDAAADAAADLALLDERIDGLLLRGFDQFVACRERVHELKEREVKARVHSLLRRAGMLDDGGAGGDSPEEGAIPPA